MLRKISFKNYKSFKAKQTIDLNQVTVLVGPNSAGKSSIIKLLALLKQSLDGSPSNHELLNIRGELVDAVDFNSLSHRKEGKDIQVEMEGDLYFDARESNYADHISGWSTKTQYNFSKILESNKILFSIKNNYGKRKLIVGEYQYKSKAATDHRGQYNYLESINFKAIRKNIGNKIFKIIDDISSRQYNKPGFFKNKTGLKKYIEKEIKGIFNHEVSISNINPVPGKNNKIRGYYQVIDPYTNKSIKKCSMYETHLSERGLFNAFLKSFDKKDKKTVFPFELLSDERLKSYHPFKNEKLTECDSIKDLTKKIQTHFKSIDQTDIKLNDYISYQILVYIELYFINFELFKKNSESTYSESIDTQIKTISASIDRTLSGIRFSPPLREKPKKHQSRSELKEIYALTPDTDFKLWNKAFEEIGFNYEISVEEISNSHDLYAIKLKDKLSGVESYLDEVGYGFSQFLPYLGWKFGRYRDLKVYEQPELHLHPSAQAKLPEILIKNLSEDAGKQITYKEAGHYEYLTMNDDLKIEEEHGYNDEISLTEGGCNLIETHSEHILRGVQLLVAKGLLKPDAVSIYYVGKNKSGNSYVKKHELDENGRFIDKWPEGFFDIGFNQAMELMKAR